MRINFATRSNTNSPFTTPGERLDFESYFDSTPDVIPIFLPGFPGGSIASSQIQHVGFSDWIASHFDEIAASALEIAKIANPLQDWIDIAARSVELAQAVRTGRYDEAAVIGARLSLNLIGAFGPGTGRTYELMAKGLLGTAKAAKRQLSNPNSHIAGLLQNLLNQIQGDLRAASDSRKGRRPSPNRPAVGGLLPGSLSLADLIASASNDPALLTQNRGGAGPAPTAPSGTSRPHASNVLPNLGRLLGAASNDTTLQTQWDEKDRSIEVKASEPPRLTEVPTSKILEELITTASNDPTLYSIPDFAPEPFAPGSSSSANTDTIDYAIAVAEEEDARANNVQTGEEPPDGSATEAPQGFDETAGGTFPAGIDNFSFIGLDDPPQVSLPAFPLPSTIRPATTM